jgi:hypothetical protein
MAAPTVPSLRGPKFVQVTRCASGAFQSSLAKLSAIDELLVARAPMSCLLCMAEMTLISAIRDDRMMVPGFEQHTYLCPVCNDIERRFVFSLALNLVGVGTRTWRLLPDLADRGRK